MVHLPRKALLLVVVTLALGCGGGSTRVGAANPRPNVVFGASAPRYSVDVSHVPDTLFFEHVTVRDFQTTLTNGFRNAFGQHWSPTRAPETVHLVIDTIGGDSGGERERTMILRYQARWIAPSGQVITAFSGVAQPHDAESRGKRHLEDVVAVMLEQMVGALAEAARRPAAPPAPADTSPRLPPSKPPGT